VAIIIADRVAGLPPTDAVDDEHRGRHYRNRSQRSAL
jgi:hypothetical protein